MHDVHQDIFDCGVQPPLCCIFREVDWTQWICCVALTLPEPQSFWILLLRRHLKLLEFQMPWATVEDLITWIVIASADIASTPYLFERVRQPFVLQCWLC
ncbi:hypothetical protein TNCV_4525711 [Trichonephila clavipes]|nr:hypothetical protein TNCV_4525711 [Trichonephila clavipes]